MNKLRGTSFKENKKSQLHLLFFISNKFASLLCRNSSSMFWIHSQPQISICTDQGGDPNLSWTTLALVVSQYLSSLQGFLSILTKLLVFQHPCLLILYSFKHFSIKNASKVWFKVKKIEMRNVHWRKYARKFCRMKTLCNRI